MDKVQKKNLNDILVKLQKPVVLLLFFAMVLVFVYSLVYMTSFYKLSLLERANISDEDMVTLGLTYDMFPSEAWFLKEDSGAKLGIKMGYYTKPFADAGELQAFNHWVFNVGVIGLVISLLMFVYFSQKRKRYYVTNFVTYGLVFGFDLYVGFSILSNMIEQKLTIANLNYNIINMYYAVNATTGDAKVYSAATFDWVFIVGNVIAIVLFVAVLLGMGLVIAKAIYQIKNKSIDVSEVKINE